MSKKATAEPEAVDAQVVETRLVVTGTPGSAIEANFDAIRARIAGIVELYEGTVVTPAYLTGAKRDRAYLNSLEKEISQRRIEMKRTYMAPVVAFEAKVAELIAPIKDASTAIDAQIKAIEEQERADKRAALSAHWSEYAGVLADAVPFEQVEQQAWLLKSTPLGKAKDEIEARVERIAREDATLSELGLSHQVEAKAAYLATLDMSAAIARSKELDAQEERARRLDAEKAEIAAAATAATIPDVAEPPCPCCSEPGTPARSNIEGSEWVCDCACHPWVETAPPVAAPVAPAEEVITYAFTITCTRSQLDAITAYANSLGLHGNASRGLRAAAVPTRPVFCIACKTRIEDGVAADVSAAEIATMTRTACDSERTLRAVRR